MDEFCGSKFWDEDLTWNTNDPYFTPCFEKTVLVWSPCVFLWVFSFMEFSYLRNSKERNVPLSYINLTKLLITFLLLVLTIVDIGLAIDKSSAQDVPNVEFVTPAIKIISFCFAEILVMLNMKRGLRTSGLLFLFWFLVLIFSIPQFRTEIVGEINRKDPDADIYPFVSYMIFFPLVIILFICNCFVDGAPKESPYPEQENPCPERNNGFLSKILFAWFDSLVWAGYKRPLTMNDLWSMNPEDTSMEIVPIFDKYWNKALEEAAKENAKASSENQTSSNKKKKPEKIKSPKKASVMIPIIKAFGSTFLFGAFLKLTQDLMVFISPQVLSLLISFVSGDEYVWKGYLYAVLLFLVAMIQTLVLSQYFHRMFLVGLRIRTALTSVIYRKALKLSNSARKETTVGEIVNLMAVDAQRFMDLTAYINMIWSAPLQIALALYFLWQVLGLSVLAGLAVMILLIPFNAVIASRSKTLQVKQMKCKDERVKLMNEIINGIKVLKLYAWEPSFEAQIMNIRNKEMRVLKQMAYLNSSTSFIWSCAPFLVSLVTFATFVLSDPANILDSQTAFVSLSLFNILRFPMMMLPNMISFIIQANVSIQRLNKFLNAEELIPEDVQHNKSEVNPLTIENGFFSWGPDDIVLRDINITIPSGSLVAVVGSVGSGKTSLLSAFLGEMDKRSGRVNTYGSIAYVGQQAWIQNATLQDNILFGSQMNRNTYESIINACALRPDFEMLPGGDQTEIGEKGINLSGGQKQRVSLARAVYCDSDVYFLDDPLSAVDTHVGKHLFNKVIGPNGILKKKTRVLVTHGITYLSEVDYIIVLKDGEVSESGTYTNLLKKKGDFADFLLQHLNEATNEFEPELAEVKQQLDQITDKAELLKKLERSISSTLSETLSKTSINEDNKKQKIPRISENGEKEKASKNKLIEAEKAETGSVKWEVFSHYLKNIGLGFAIISIFGNLVYQGFSIGSNIWLSVWSADEDLVVDGVQDEAKRDLYLGVYGGLGIGQVITVSVSSLFLFIGTLNAASVLHSEMLRNILRAPTTTFFDVTPVGRILNRFSKDVDTLDNVLPMSLRGWVSCFFSVIATLVVISISTPIFIAIIIPCGIVYYLVQRIYIATSRQLKREESVTRSPIYSHFGESVTGASVIRAYGIQTRFIKESEEKVDLNQICYYPSIVSNRWLAVRLETVGNIIILFAALFAVIGKDSINPGIVGLSVSYALQITQTLNWLVRMTSEVETNVVAVERIKEYVEVTTEASWEILQTVPAPEWPTKGHVKFDKLVMRYRETADPVLHNISCDIQPKEKIGIVGRTGAGKSTLTLALFRILEASEGRILIDDIDISTLGLHSLRSRLTIIPQDPVLFSGTLRNNLDPFDKFTDDEVWRALEQSHLKPFVKGLSAGLKHAVIEGGDNLSVGQRQLVCLARALLRKTRVLILDEATAAVDLETDDLIQKTIRVEFADCTVLTIAHRLNTIMDSTRVLVLEKGRVEEFDTPQNLLGNKKTIFYGMAKDAGLVN
ncbi:multidrug resistance-associated protein 1-like [Arctopsyche grandis]|uniref:multidrug resistance-associated protein 1-like n=1 Tax=Arctopsyche grandis TaxID=121162 RepID=UPI00406D9CF8